MNRLTLSKRVQILSMLAEGSSMRSISRVVDVSINTVNRLLVDAGKACEGFHDKQVRSLNVSHIQCAEIWSFCYSKAKKVKTAKVTTTNAGDVWTWTALDRESKMILSWMVGGRDAGYATEFLNELKERLAHHVQLSTDGNKAYLDAGWYSSGIDDDYMQLVKLYGESKEQGSDRKFSLSTGKGARKQTTQGDLDHVYISTSLVAQHNLSMRMLMSPINRVTNAFSRKIENHCHALALYFVYYNFVKIHKYLGVTPAMAAGVTVKDMKMEDIIALIDKPEVSRIRGLT